MEGRGLQRSYTQVEFPVTRSARNQHHYHQLKPGHHIRADSSTKRNNNNIHTTNNNVTGTRIKPGMELYKPPNQRENGGRLNVHAKEFIMSGSPLQGSKSTGNILHDDAPSRKPSSIKPITNYPLAAAKSGHIQTQQTRGVKFAEEQETSRGRDLKRSKSMSHAHGASATVSSELVLFEKHPAAALVKKACFNPVDLQSVQLMELAKVLVDRAMDDRAHAQSYASICLTIVEKESSGTFLESLLNTSQYTVEKKCYKDGTHRYHAFMAFLNELYSLLKPKQIQFRSHATAVSPTLTVLSLIVQVCQSVLSQKVLTQRTEVECLFFTVTTVGRDIETEEPKLLDSLMWSVRDAFLSPTTSAPIKKTLLQLVELRATRWHLPATAIMYYQSPNP